MKKIIDYLLIANENFFDLNCNVRDAIKAGYEPIGGLMQNNAMLYIQAMIKYEN